MNNTADVELESPPQFKTTTRYKPIADGHLVKTSQSVAVTTTSTTGSKTTPPLVDLKITNPIVYIKAWWKRLIGNEGIKLTLQIKPLTAMVLTVMVSGVGFGVGRWTIPEPITQYIPILASPTPAPTPDPWKETAYSGKLQVSGSRYFLLTTSAEAITLEVPATVNLHNLIGKRIMAVGKYNQNTRIMVVSDAKDLEILPTTPIPLPTILPTPTPVPSPSPE